MTAKDVSVGLTYEVLVSDKLVPVTLTSECTWGGWYGKNKVTGHTVRIKTAGRLRKQLTGEIAASTEAAKQDSKVHTQTKEATVAAPTDAKAARAARRTANALAKADTTAKEVNEASKTPRNAKGQIQSRKPAAKQAAKSTPKSTPTPKESTVSKTTKSPARKPAATTNGKPAGTVKITAKRKPAAKTAPVLNTAPVEIDIDAIVAAAVAEALAKAAPAAKVTSKRAAKPVAKPVTVKLKAANAVVNSYQFKYMGKDKQPLVTAVYVMIPLLERFASDGTPVEVALTEYVPSGKQKPQPKSKIRYSGSDDTIRDLYVDRALITKMGYSEANAPVVTVEVIGDNEIALTFPAA